jgi:hypothetical protein
MPAVATAPGDVQPMLVASTSVPSVAPTIASAGVFSSSKSKARRLKPQPCVKRMAITMKKSRLAVEGAPSALTTPEASSSGGGAHLLKSIGFDFKHATSFLYFIYCDKLGCVRWMFYQYCSS